MSEIRNTPGHHARHAHKHGDNGPSHKLDRPTVFKVVTDDVHLRTHPMGLTLGDLKKGQHFVAEYVTEGGWAWGHAMGHADRKGWIPFRSDDKDVLKKTDHPLPEGYKSVGKPTDLSKRFDFVTSDDVKADKSGKTHYTERAVVTHPTTMYANYSHGTPRDPVGELKPGQVIRARYNYNDDFAMVLVTKRKDDPNAKWVFVRRDDFKLQEKPSRKVSRMALPED